MRIVADLHVHSRYSRACSKVLSLTYNAHACERKGVNLLGTGDFTHPLWFEEIEKLLTQAEPGLYRLLSGESTVRYMITSEVALIYKRDGKTRRVHLLIFAPSLSAARAFNTWLDTHGYSRKSDGRPILGLDSELLYKELKQLDPDFVIAPAHIWTPWFAVFGSKSGFDSLEACFGDMTSEVFCVETGLSSDPAMNHSLSTLDNIALISNSDAHGPQNFGREANVFEIEESALSFAEIMRVLKTRDPQKFLHTIEFYPEEGKYHADGHAKCGIVFSPEETAAHKGLCPVCHLPLTIGVQARVHALADRPLLTEPGNFVSWKYIIPLPELVAETLGVKTVTSPKVVAVIDRLVHAFGNEFAVLLDVAPSDIAHVAGERIAEGVKRMREGSVVRQPGYDGVYGKISVWRDTSDAQGYQQLQIS